MKKKNWQLVGYLPSGDGVYCSSDGDHAKEKDFQYLVEMTSEELQSVMPEREVIWK